MNPVVVTALNIYPVKSLTGISLKESELDSLGLKYDRRWMVVTPAGLFMTQRRYPWMALIQTRIEQGGVSLSVSGKTTHHIPATASGKTLTVRIWDDIIDAIHVSADTDTWLSEAIGEPCHLVWFPENCQRQVDLDYAQPGDHTAFSDGFPMLLISEDSLADLNGRLALPVTMKRFRPNIVVRGGGAFAEDQWQQIHIGGVGMRVVKPCSRCVLTTVDPETGEKSGREPLATLASYRRQDNKVMFGQNVIHEQTGTLRVGDGLGIV